MYFFEYFNKFYLEKVLIKYKLNDIRKAANENLEKAAKHHIFAECPVSPLDPPVLRYAYIRWVSCSSHENHG